MISQDEAMEALDRLTERLGVLLGLACVKESLQTSVWRPSFESEIQILADFIAPVVEVNDANGDD